MRTEDRNSVIRLALGVTGVFALGLFLGWPLAVVGAVFTALFLQAPAALPLAAFAKLFVFSIGLMFISFLLSSVFAPYPVVFLILVAIGIILSFMWSVSGAGVLPGVIALMGALMIPNLVLQSQDLALVLVFWIPLNLLFAGFVSTLMFVLLPAEPQTGAQKKAAASSDFDPNRRIVRMSLVTVPFAMAFFISGASALLVLFFVALLSQQLAAMPSMGKTVAKAMLTANLLGAAISIICYELNVIAPVILTPILVCLFFCLSLGALGKTQVPLAAAAGSALTTVLIVYGGSISPFSDEADVKSITRVFQVASAAFFVIAAYVVVDEFWPERKQRAAQ
ncbi:MULTISPECIES: DUF2955 domain-containing protein [unclassified Ruegeria]|uniref:DUF2955 domain-containing protein n=1 Tax=unclassified Ruegeria TaxID=2625375 RepID=UPI0014889A50|nr:MULTISPECIES: DUF2955 domain-containing protein [unclassified Ruegeria]NOD64277.1 DUF2955 domain-containing protein [Ruegeria sp. HKCCD6109]